MKTRLEEVRELVSQAKAKMDSILLKRRHAVTCEEKKHSEVLYSAALEEYVQLRLEKAKLEHEQSQVSASIL